METNKEGVGMEDSALSREDQKFPLRRNKDFEEVGIEAMWISEGRVSKTEGRASVKWFTFLIQNLKNL